MKPPGKKNVNDNDPGNVVELFRPRSILACANCDCIDFNLEYESGQYFILCAECGHEQD